MVQQWIETERLISAEQAAWKDRKASSEALLELRQKELVKLDEELAAMGGSVQGVDAYSQSMENKLVDYQKSQQQLKARLQSLSVTCLNLIKLLPEVQRAGIADDVEVLKAAAEHSPRELMQATLNVMQIVEPFQQSVTVADETLSVGQQKVRAHVMYLGMSRAFFYLGEQGKERGGIGVPKQGSWQWQWKEGLGAEIAKAIEVQQKKVRPELIFLPMQLTAEKKGGAQ